MQDGVVDDIKNAVDLTELIESYGIQVRRSGRGGMACCPFHHEKTPSFSINGERGFYHCFGCGESGDVIKFVQKMDGLGFADAVKKLAERAGIVIEETQPDPERGKRQRLYALMAELAQFYHRCLNKISEAASARKYLEQRALAGAVTDDWLIGYAPNGSAIISTWAEKHGFSWSEMEAAGVGRAPANANDRGYHRFGGRLMFPIKDRRGRVVAFSGRILEARKNTGKYVNSPETDIFRKSNVLFGFDRAAGEIARSPHREVLICEGQIDCIRLHSAGFVNAVASQGTAFTEEHVRMLAKVADVAVLVFDDDAAGHKATIRAAGLLLAADIPVRTVALPDGDDPDSFLRKNSAEKFQKLLDEAESIIAFQCRVARAQEHNPTSLDAVKRVTRAVLATIGCSRSPVLRAGMIGEAAKLLGLPVVALNDEMERIGADLVKNVVAAPIDSADRPDFTDEELEAIADEHFEISEEEPDANIEEFVPVSPPSKLEFAFMSFLFENECEKDVAEPLGEFLPKIVFEHEFTAKFVETWKVECVTGNDCFVEFAKTLTLQERQWLDAVDRDAERTQASSMRLSEMIHDFIRRLWQAKLERERGAISIVGTEADERRRIQIATYTKRLNMVKWHEVKEIIRKELSENGQQTVGSEYQG